MDLIGRTLGQYRILEPLGQGGMAFVFKAYHPALERYVALKALLPQQALAPGFFARFLREARAVAQLNHPNILPVYDFGQEGDLSYIVMKLVAGGTLRDRLHQPLELPQTVHIVEQVAAALDHAHGRRVLHRDVKPANVLLDEGDWVQLSDFGLVKLLAGEPGLTASGASVGTPAYASPEQAQGLEVDHRTDVYALGVILYEMVTGRVPFQAPTPMATMVKHITEAPPPPCQVNPRLPLAVEEVILKALAKAPDERYPSAGELAGALQAAVSGLAVRGPGVAVAPSPGYAAAAPTPEAAAAQRTLERRYLSKLRQLLDNRFDEEELRTLCFDLGVDYEDLPARGQAHKARELVAYLERHRRVPELIAVGRVLRPDIPWDEIFPQPISGVGVGVAPAAASPAALEVTPPPEPSRPPQVADFVGREAELAAYADRLANDQPVVIAGMAGVGKTALAVTLAQRVADAEHTFWHTFHEGEGVQALLWKLAAFLAWRGQGDLWDMLQGAQQGGGQPPPTEVLLDYLFQTLRGRGYTLCLDDWHLVEADPLLEQLVERMCRLVRTGELVLIVTSRRAPAFVGPTAFEPLAGLSAADTQALLAARGLELPEALVADLHTHTEGNAELLTLAMGALERAGGPARLVGRLAETGSVARFLMKEVDTGLSGVEREVMGAVAVLLGYPATRDAIEALLEDGGGAGRALHGLSARYLLTVSPGEWGSEYSQHALVREFYYDLLGRREREGMHRRAGGYYESVEPDALKAARHYQLAGEHKRAAELATADVGALINRGQVRELGLLLERFEAVQLDAEGWIEVNLAQGQVYTLVGDGRWARASYEEALSSLGRLADSSQMRELKARACRGMGGLLQYESPQEALDWLRRGLDELAGANILEEAALHIKIGGVQSALGDYGTSLRSLQRGLRLLPQDSSLLRADALNLLGSIYCIQGDNQKGKDYYLEALEIHKHSHNYWGIIAIGQNLGIEAEIAGDWASATIEYRNALDLAERLGNVAYQAGLELALGILHTKKGETNKALTHLTRCLELARHHNLKEYSAACQSSMGDLYIRLGDWEAAIVSLQEAEQLAMEIDTRYQLSEIHRGWAQVQLSRGALDQAKKCAERSLNLAHDLGMDLEEGISFRVLGQVLLAENQHRLALDAFETSLSILTGLDPYEAARTKMHWGLGLLSGDDVEHGGELLWEARLEFQGLSALWDLAAVDKALKRSSERRKHPSSIKHAF